MKEKGVRNKKLKKSVLFICGIFLALFLSYQVHATDVPKPLIFVGDMDFPPIESLRDGKPEGLNVELLHALSRVMKRDIEIRLMPWDDAQQKVINGEGDALTLLGPTEKRKIIYDFSEPMLEFQFHHFVREENITINKLKDVEGKSVGVTKAGYAKQVLEPNEKIILRFVKNNLEGFRLLKSGEIDTMATSMWVGAYTLQENKIKGIRIIEKPFAENITSVVVKKGNTALLNEINLGIAKLKQEGTIREITKRWSGKKIIFLTKETLQKYIYIGVTLGLSVFVGLLSMWIILLHKNSAQRKKAEETLRDSEERFRTSVENMLDCFGIYTAIRDESGNIVDFRIEYVNKAACVNNHLTEEEQVGKRLLELLPAHRETGLFAKYCQVVETGKPLAEESLIYEDVYKKKHLIRAFDIRAVKLGDGFAAAWRDISEQKQAEESLKESRGLLAETERMGKVGGWEFNIDTGKQIWTEETYNIHEVDLTYEPTVEKGVNFYTPASRPIIERALQRAIEHGEPFDVELEIMTAKGNLRSVHAIGKTDSEHHRVYGFFQNITERKKAEETVRNREEQLELFFRQSLDGFFFMTLDEPVAWDDTVNKDDVLDYVFAHQRITKVNDAILKQYGTRLEEFIGSTPNDFFAHDLAHGKDVWRRFFDAGQLHTETDERKLDGTPIWIEGDYICMYDDQGRITGHFGIQRDITERKRVEQQMLEHDDRLRSLASELSLAEERQRHRIATELHDNTSQELAFTLMKLQNIRETAGRDSRESLSEVCEVMSKVVENIRNMTFDICSPTLYRFGLEAAVSELLDDKLGMRDGINYDFYDDGKTKSLLEDVKITLFQSVRELVNNIIKHAQACNVTVDIRKCEDTIRITVSDDGVGFKVDELESPKRSGSGFGLFSIAERLKYIGGDFEFESRPGQGSSFTLETPLEADTNFCQGEYDGG